MPWGEDKWAAIQSWRRGGLVEPRKILVFQATGEKARETKEVGLGGKEVVWGKSREGKKGFASN